MPATGNPLRSPASASAKSDTLTAVHASNRPPLIHLTLLSNQSIFPKALGGNAERANQCETQGSIRHVDGEV